MKQRTKPLPAIISGRDPITGRKLIIWSRSEKRWIPNSSIPKCISGKEELVENYGDAKKANFKGWVCHHRFELNSEGKSVLTMIDLVNKGLYYHRPPSELIWLTRKEHGMMHSMAENNGMYGIDGASGIDHPNWKGDDATDHSKKCRKYRERNRQKYRDYLRQYRAKKRALRDCALLHRSNSN